MRGTDPRTRAVGVTSPVHACAVDDFRFPDGVEFLGDDTDGHVHLEVSIPLDDDGYVGRECPECEQHFRVAHEDYDALPDDVRLWCVYCGHQDDHSEFLTRQQHDRVMRAAGDFAMQLVGKTLDRSFSKAARRSRGSLVRITYRSKPFYPKPLPGIDEERLVRERRCADCKLRYAVFGDHRFCPVCGLLPPLVVALDALGAETIRLDVLADLTPDAAVALGESGVLDRTYVDTIENVVGIVEAMAGGVFRAAVPDAEAVLKGKGRIFQRLDDLADLFQTEITLDLRAAVEPSWADLIEAWAARHVFTHCDGIVDTKYRTAVPSTPLRIGQRLRIRERHSRNTLALAERLCRAIAGATPSTEAS
jgi:hypothetical protein